MMSELAGCTIILMSKLADQDPALYEILQKERQRQADKLSMIPSENYFSPAVREAVGSEFAHKYSEGNIGARYYEGCEFIDELEQLTIDRAKAAFKLPEDWGVNVQALSGSNANLAVYLALLQPGDTILSMYLPDGGHLSHGWSIEPGQPSDPSDEVYEGGSRKVNIVSRLFNVVQYKTDPETRELNYDHLGKIAKSYKPKLIIAGGTAYPRLLDHEAMARIAHAVGAYYMADVAHEAGLIAAGCIPSPVGHADVVTMTTHKTMRAGRGAIILAKQEMIKNINKAVLPGLQGGPHNHNIAGICVGLGEILQPEYKDYAKQIQANTQAFAEQLHKNGFNLVAGGADKHLVLIDLTGQPVLGKRLARALDAAGIVANYNTMPQETRSPVDPSAIRFGTPWLTTRGMKEEQMKQVADWVKQVAEIAEQWQALEWEDYHEAVVKSDELAEIAGHVKQLCQKFPLPQ